MDFDPNEDQAAVLEAVEALLEQHAGPARAIQLQPKGEYDQTLHSALAGAGFMDVVRSDEMGPLEGALIVERVSGHAGVVAVGAQVLVAPALTVSPPAGPIALRAAGQGGPVRYAAHASTLIEVGEDIVRIVPLRAGEAEPVPSNFGYPMRRNSPDIEARGEPLGPDAAERAAGWRRLAQ